MCAVARWSNVTWRGDAVRRRGAARLGVAGVARRGEDNSDIMARLFASWQQIERRLPCGRRRCELVRVRSESARCDHTNVSAMAHARQHSVQGGRSVPHTNVSMLGKKHGRFCWWVRAHSDRTTSALARPCFIPPLYSFCSACAARCVLQPRRRRGMEWIPH